jgi:MFS family permease
MNPNDQSLWQSLRELPRAAWLLYLGTFINRFGSFVIPFLTIYAGDHFRALGFSDADATAAVAKTLVSYGLGHLIAALAGGYLTDKIGRRKTIALSMFSSAASMLLLSQAESLAAIMALTALTGLTTELYRPASTALLADVVTPEQRITAFAALRWALNAGFAFGPATAGFLAGYSFKWLFIGDAITSALFGLVAWFLLPHGLRAGGESAKWSAAWRVMRGDRRFHKLLLAQFAMALVFLQMSSTFSLHVTSWGISKEMYGLLMSLNGVMIILMELPLTMRTRRLPQRATIAVGYLLIGFGFMLNAWATQLPALVLVIVVFTIGEMIAMPIASAFIVDGVPPEMRGRYMGMYGLVWALALTVGPGTGVRLHAGSPLLLWGACGVLGVIAAITVLWTKEESRTTGDNP